MTSFAKTWLNAAAASVSTFTALPYIPAEARADETTTSEQLALPLGDVKRSARIHVGFGQHAKAA